MASCHSCCVCHPRARRRPGTAASELEALGPIVRLQRLPCSAPPPPPPQASLVGCVTGNQGFCDSTAFSGHRHTHT